MNLENARNKVKGCQSLATGPQGSVPSKLKEAKEVALFGGN